MTPTMASSAGSIVARDSSLPAPLPSWRTTFGAFKLSPEQRLLERDGVPVCLGGRALDVLITFLELAIASAEPRHATALAGSLGKSDLLKLASKRLTRAKKAGR